MYGNDLPGVDVFAPSTLFNPARFSDQHGVWARSGWRELTAQVMNFNLAALTGVQTGSARVRYVVRFSKDWQSISGTQRGGSMRWTKTRWTRRRCRPWSSTRHSAVSA